MYYRFIDSPVGELRLVSDGQRLTEIAFADKLRSNEASAKAQMEPKNDLPIFQAAQSWLEHYFAGAKPDPSTILTDTSGTLFARTVWNELAQIPYGETRTYKEIAQNVATVLGRKTMSSQAVGGAIARNPLVILVPCHRVLGQNGQITGYSGGLSRKVQLLQLEGIATADLVWPK